MIYKPKRKALPNPIVRVECLINNEVVAYDMCGKGSKEKLDEDHPSFKYIGSSHTILINGVENIQRELTHFYVRK